MSTLQGSPGLTLPARRSPVNLRLVVLLSVVALPFLYFGYVIVDQAVTGGVKDRGGYYDVDLKSLGQFPFDPVQDDVNNIPQKWRQLDGKKVALVGEMYAGGSAAPKVPAFQLVYSIQKCCFGGPPRVQERVFVRAPPGKFVPFYWQPVRVTGTLHVNARREEGQVVSVFDMDVERVEPIS
jgi:hypothetical protein